MPAVRIARVRLKATGQEVAVLRRKERGEIERGLVEAAAALADAGPLAGYFIVAWDNEGAYNRGFACPDTSAIPRTLLPAWIEEIVRREVVTATEVRQVIEREYVVR